MLSGRLVLFVAAAAVLAGCASANEVVTPMQSGEAATSRACGELLVALKGTTDDRFVLEARSGSDSLQRAMSMTRAQQSAAAAKDAEAAASGLVSDLPTGDLRTGVEKLLQSRKDLQLLFTAVQGDRPAEVGALTVKVGAGRSAAAELFRKSCPAQASSLPTLAPLSPPATATPTAIAPPPAPARWYPKGYNEVQDGIAVRWVKNKDLKCPAYSGGCWGMYVIARDGCPQNLYVELSVENRAGDVVGFTNDLVGSVGAGKRAKLTFTGSGAAAAFSKASCY